MFVTMSDISDIDDVTYFRILNMLLHGITPNSSHEDSIPAPIDVKVVVFSIFYHHFVQDDTTGGYVDELLLIPQTRRTGQTVNAGVQKA